MRENLLAAASTPGLLRSGNEIAVIEPLAADSPDLIPAMEANYRAFWETLAASPLMKIEQRPQGMRFVTDVKNPVFNGIMSPRLPADDAAVEAELDYFKSRGLPMSWTLGPNDTPADLGERLERLGVRQTSTNPGMIVDLSQLADEDWPPGLEVRRIEDDVSFQTFNRVLCEGFGMPDTPEFAEMFIATGTGENGEIASFLGLLDGQPVGTSRAILMNGLAGVYVVATAESARGKGIGRAMTLAACLYGKERGYKLGTLQASDIDTGRSKDAAATSSPSYGASVGRGLPRKVSPALRGAISSTDWPSDRGSVSGSIPPLIATIANGSRAA